MMAKRDNGRVFHAFSGVRVGHVSMGGRSQSPPGFGRMQRVSCATDVDEGVSQWYGTRNSEKGGTDVMRAE